MTLPGLPQLVLGAPDSRRAQGLRQAVLARGGAMPQWLRWCDWLAEPQRLTQYLAQRLAAGPCLLRIEPPGDEPEATERLRALGGWQRHTAPVHGEWLAMDAWFRGFGLALARLSEQIEPLAQRTTDISGGASTAMFWNHPEDILCMSDKWACQDRLAAAGVLVPARHGLIDSYAHLQDLARSGALPAQVFLKARYGSSAAGVVAYRHQTSGAGPGSGQPRQLAVTTAHWASAVPGHGPLVNVKRPRQLQHTRDIAPLIDTLAAQGLYAETWIPKPRHLTGHFDLRILSFDGEPAHRIARLSRHPMTNLHLDAQRVPVETVLTADQIARLEDTVRHAARCFPRARLVGWDVIVRGAQCWVLEANAFGDLLPGLLWQGRDSYTHAIELP